MPTTTTLRRLALPLAVGLALLAAVGVYALVQAGAQRPMSGQIALAAGPDGSACDSERIVILLEGSGNLTHLGKTTITARNCAGIGLETGASEISDGNSTFTAADGSTITATYEGSQTAPVDGVAQFTTTHTIVAGTGRFAGASGQWTIAGTVSLNTGELLGDVDGWISY
jgi:hypothetical protein